MDAEKGRDRGKVKAAVKAVSCGQATGQYSSESRSSSMATTCRLWRIVPQKEYGKGHIHGLVSGKMS